MPHTTTPPANPADPTTHHFTGSFWLGLLAVFAMGACYVAFPLANFTDAKDALSYATRISDGEPHFHPNHLIYEPVIFVVHSIVELVWPTAEILTTMRWVSTLSALPFLVLCYLIIWRAHQLALIATLGTGVIAFSFGVWVYAVSPDGYLPPLFFTVLALVLLDPAGWRGEQSAPSVRRIASSALVMACAVLFHQLYVVFALVLGFTILASPAFGRVSDRVRGFLIFGSISGGVTLIVYILAYMALEPEDPLFGWARGYAQDTLHYGDAPSLLSPLKGTIGAVSALLTMNGVMAFDSIADRLSEAFPTKSLLEERYIAETGIPTLLRVPILFAMLGSVLLWIAMAGMSIKGRWQRQRPPEYIDRVLLVAVVLYAILVIIWEPTNREFWIQTYVFATLWCARQIYSVNRARVATLTGLVVFLFFVNFSAAVRPLTAPHTDYWRAYNKEALEHPEDIALIVTSCTWLCEWYLRYFIETTVVSPLREDPARLQEIITTAGPGKILISSLAYTPHPLYPLQEGITHTDRTEAFRRMYPPPDTLALPPPLEGQLFFELKDGRVAPLNLSAR